MGEPVFSATGEVLPVFAGVGPSGAAVVAEGRFLIAGEAVICPVPGAVKAAVAMEGWPVVMGETAFTATGKVLPVFPGIGPAGAAVVVKRRPPIAGEAAVCPVPGAVKVAVAMEGWPVVMGETAFSASGEISPAFTLV